MERPKAIIDFLGETEPDSARVNTIYSSKMILVFEDDDALHMEFDSKECEKILQSTDTADLFVTALGELQGDCTAVELHALDMPPEVRELLEQRFDYVEEF